MKAAVVREFGQPLVIEDRPGPDPVIYETRPLGSVNAAVQGSPGPRPVTKEDEQ